MCENLAHAFCILGLCLYFLLSRSTLEHDDGNSKMEMEKLSAVLAWIIRVIGFLIAGYGVYAFDKWEIGNYVLLISHFGFFNFDESLLFFLLNYIAVMELFLFIGHYLFEGLKRIGRKNEVVSQRLRIIGSLVPEETYAHML